jgi:hypothetical protein
MADGTWEDYFKETEYFSPTALLLSTSSNDGSGAPSPRKPMDFGYGEVTDQDPSADRSLRSAGWGVQSGQRFWRFTRKHSVKLKLSNLFCIQKDTKSVAEKEAADNVRYDENILKRVSRSIQEHNSIQSVYYMIRSQNLSYIPNDYLVRKEGNEGRETQIEANLYDSSGATVVHQFFQYQRYDTVKWLVRSFPEFSLRPHKMSTEEVYSGDKKRLLPFGGQNLLHMAVLAKNHEFARWLLDFYSKHSDISLFKLLTARVLTRKGSYFRKTGAHYYGETPLQFAVCMNDTEMVDLILSFVSFLHTDLLAEDTPDGIRAVRNLLFMPDCNGNNVIHLCVLHNIPDMYDHVKHIALEMIRQELMRAFHKAVSVNQDPARKKPYRPMVINYKALYNEANTREASDAFTKSVVEIPRFEFSGYIRNVDPVAFPSTRVQDLWFDMQFWKLSLKKDQTEEDKTVLELLKNVVARDRQQPTASGGRQARGERTRSPSYIIDTDKVTSGQGLSPAVTLSESSPVDAPDSPPKKILAKSKPDNDAVLVMDPSSGGIHDMKDRNSILQRFASLKDYDWDNYFSSRKDEIKNEMRQWLYGSDIGLKDGAVNRLFNEFFLLGLNESGHSPVTLAAAKGKAEILRHLITENVVSRDRNYDFDLTAIEFPISIVRFNLNTNQDESLYTPPLPATTTLRSAISWICRNEDHYQLIDSIPEIKALVTAKWDRVGRLIANRNNLLQLGFLIPIMLLTCLVGGNEFHRNSVDNQYSTYLLTWCSAVVLIIVGTDICYYGQSGFSFIGLLRTSTKRNQFLFDVRKIIMDKMPVGAGLFDWMMRLIVGGIFMAIIFVRFYMNVIRSFYGHDGVYFDHVYSTLIGACCLCSLLYSFLFLTLFEDDFGSFLMTVTHILLNDFFYFARFFVRIVVMFGLALKTITDDIDDNGFVHAFRCMWGLLRLAFNVSTNEFDEFTTQHQFESVWFSILLTLYNLMVNILIINLLIAVMSNTYTAYVGRNALAKLRCQRYLWLENFLGALRVVHRDNLYQKYCHKQPQKDISVAPSGNSADLVPAASADVSQHISSEKGTPREAADIRGFSYFFRLDKKFDMVSKRANDRFSKLNKEREDLTDEHFDRGKLVPVTAGNAHRIFSPERLRSSVCADSDLANIFKCTFWTNSVNEHPKPGQLITSSDVIKYVWSPTDVHKADFCRYVTQELEKEGSVLEVTNQKRKVLLILDPQNDFCDNIPALVDIDLLELSSKGEVINSSAPNSPSSPSSSATASASDILVWRSAMLTASSTTVRVQLKADTSRRGVLVGLKMKVTKKTTDDPAIKEPHRGKIYAEIRWTEIVDMCRVTMCARTLPSSGQSGRKSKRMLTSLSPHAGLNVSVLDIAEGKNELSTNVMGSNDLSQRSAASLKIESHVTSASFETKQHSAGAIGADDKAANSQQPASSVARGHVSFRDDSPAISVGSVDSIPPPATEDTNKSARARARAWQGYIHDAVPVCVDKDPKRTGIIINVFEDSDRVEILLDVSDDAKQDENSKGSLATPGAYADFQRTSKLIKEKAHEYDEIYVSRDCHRHAHIAHKPFWDGVHNKITEFTKVRYVDVFSGYYKTKEDHFQVRP